MSIDLFAGIAVSDFARSLAWYERLFGAPPTMFPHPTEAVWQLAEHRHVYIVEQPEHAGHARTTVVIDDLDERNDAITARSIDPAEQETYANGVRKVTYRDPDGNEFSYGAVPTS